MRNQHSVSRFLLLAASTLMILSAVALLPQRFTVAQATNLLTNGGFEGQYVKFENDATRVVAPGWSPWNVARKAADPGFVNLTPEYRSAANPKRIHGGQAAQEWMTFFATHTGGVFHKKNGTPGRPRRLPAFFNARAL